MEQPVPDLPQGLTVSLGWVSKCMWGDTLPSRLTHLLPPPQSVGSAGSSAVFWSQISWGEGTFVPGGEEGSGEDAGLFSITARVCAR